MINDTRRKVLYAVSKSGILTNIKDAHNDSEDYYCPNCRCKMIKKCGSIRIWHFAHDWRHADDIQKSCSYESYLHKYAKLRLKQWFDKSESIILKYPHTIVCKEYNSCKISNESKCKIIEHKFCDLKEQFDKCIIESPVKESNGNYRADLLLTSTKDPSRRLLIEIKVSHECSDKKKISNAKIIEFDVSCEEDIDYIISHDIEESDKCRYYGFKNLIKFDSENIIAPIYNLEQFSLYKSGKTFCKQINCKQISYHSSSSLFMLTARMSVHDYWHLNLLGLEQAYNHEIRLPNCYLCENKLYNAEQDCNVCKLSSLVIKKGSDCGNCKNYKFNYNSFDILKTMAPIEIVNIWSAK